MKLVIFVVQEERQYCTGLSYEREINPLMWIGQQSKCEEAIVRFILNTIKQLRCTYLLCFQTFVEE